MQSMVSHGISDFIEELCHLFVRLAFHAGQNLLNEVGLVPPASFHDQLAG